MVKVGWFSFQAYGKENRNRCFFGQKTDEIRLKISPDALTIQPARRLRKIMNIKIGFAMTCKYLALIVIYKINAVTSDVYPIDGHYISYAIY